MKATYSIEKRDDKIFVVSDYSPDLPTKARKLGGSWNGKSWEFDARDEERIIKLYNKIYGDPTEKLVTLKCKAKDTVSEWQSGIFLAGRCIARATGRDSGAKYGDGIVFLKGSADSGGSMKNWVTKIEEGSIFEIRDVPESKAKLELENTEFEVTILEDKPKINVELLSEERCKLLVRLAEIDLLLLGELG